MGTKTGWVGSAYQIGTCIGSIIWGYFADFWGRKMALILGIIGSTFSSLFFGFSMNYTWAIAGRVIWGLLNGNVLVSKTYLSEVSSKYIY